jgi:hypothetical protein
MDYVIYFKSQYNDIEITEPGLNDDEITVVKKYIKISFDNCWAKFNKYYFKFDFNFIYTGFVVLYSDYKWLYFEK